MKGEINQQVMNEFQEIVLDQKLTLLETKGTLFRYKGIGGGLIKGRSLGTVLDKFWTKSVKQVCQNALDNGITGNVVEEQVHQTSILALLFVAVPLVSGDRIRGVILTIHDITVSRRLERHRTLREKMKIISKVASHIVHHMNNPIAAILNGVGGLLVASPQSIDGERLHQELQNIQEQLYSMALVTNALTVFSSEDRNDFKLVSLNRVIDHAVHLIRLIDSRKEISIVLELDENLPRILGNEVTLEQALVNLCRNAVEAMPEGGTLTINSNLDKQFKDFASVSVHNTGANIPEEHLEMVFDPFFTTKNQDHKGLGLTVCYGIIANHGGSIELSSKEGLGTTVQIILPIAKL
ncbi:MAG: hypothetical protein EHM72_07730 [Calditrichaeota bacterium]|nr:MAG: hypothetical protein EHM72_07730 [Calditrichota bacterium]